LDPLLVAVAVQTASLGDSFKSVPYGAELFVKDRWFVSLTLALCSRAT